MALVNPVVLSAVQSVVQRVDGVLGELPLAKRYSNCIGAYSLRDIGADGGPVVDGYNTTSTSTTAYTAAEITAGAPTGSGRVTVSKWYDQSGNGNHLIQTTTGFQPELVNGAGNQNTDQNGFPTVFFQDVNFDLGRHFSLTSSVTVKTLFVVTTPDTSNTGSKYVAIMGDTVTSGKSYVLMANNSGLSWAISIDGAVSDVGTWYQNGAAGVTGGDLGSFGDIAADTTALQNVIWSSPDPATPTVFIGRFATQYMRGSMTEILLFDDYMNADRTDIRDDINNHYSLF